MVKGTLNFTYITLFMLIFSPSTAQFEMRMGAGLSLMEKRDVTLLSLENELNYKSNSYFSFNALIGIGQRIGSDLYTASSSYKMAGINVFLSPFTNEKRNDFRIGAGLSYYTIDEVWALSRSWQQETLSFDIDYDHERRSSAGMSIIIENTYKFTEKVLFGVKLFSQIYQNSDLHYGCLFKTGITL